VQFPTVEKCDFERHFKSHRIYIFGYFAMIRERSSFDSYKPDIYWYEKSILLNVLVYNSFYHLKHQSTCISSHFILRNLLVLAITVFKIWKLEPSIASKDTKCAKLGIVHPYGVNELFPMFNSVCLCLSNWSRHSQYF
jgi:hypothetical protein